MFPSSGSVPGVELLGPGCTPHPTLLGVLVGGNALRVENVSVSCILGLVCLEQGQPSFDHETTRNFKKLGLVHWETQRDEMGREVGGAFRIGNSYTPMADSCQCTAKPIQYL